MFEGYALILGAMKCGTTTLHRCLTRSPHVASARPKEPDAFARHADLDSRSYDRFFPKLDKNRHKWALDSSTGYSKVHLNPEVAGRIAAFPGNTRLIYLMRDPVDRIESHIAHNDRQGRSRKTIATNALQTSKYRHQLGAFDRVGLAERIMLIDFDDLANDLQGTKDRVCDFLGIERLPEEPVWSNRRQSGDAWLSPRERAEYADLLKDDMQALCRDYGFRPAWILNSRLNFRLVIFTLQFHGHDLIFVSTKPAAGHLNPPRRDPA